MSSRPKDQLPTLAAALIRLRGETLEQVSKATDIRATNISVWLRGKEQVISAKRLVDLLHHLGMEGGRLRAGMLHRWHDRGTLKDTKLVLDTLLANTKPVWLFQDQQPGLIKTRFLLAGDVLVRLEIKPDLDQASDLAEVIKADRVITTPAFLSWVSTDSVASACNELLALAENNAADIGHAKLLEGLMSQLKKAADSNVESLQEWQQLELVLRNHLKAGRSPGEITRLLEKHL